MVTSLRRLFGLSVVLSLLFAAGSATVRAQSAADTLAALSGAVPLFRSNAGQWHGEVLFRSEARGATLSFLRNGFSVAATRTRALKPGKGVPSDTAATERSTLVWNVNFRGAKGDALLVPHEERGRSATYIRATAATSHTHSPVDYSALRYNGVYHNIDLLFKADQGGRMKYDCLVQPGGNVDDVAMELSGVEGVRVESDGRLVITTQWGEVQEEAPYAYQVVEGVKREVEVRYRLLDATTYGFGVVGEYDHTRELVIDPVILAWSTFVGGRSTDGYIYEIDLDREGNVYVAGFNEQDFPTLPGAYARSMRGRGCDAVVFKLSSDGKRLLASTFIGSTANDFATDIAVAPSGEVWVCGYTMGGDFPQTPSSPVWRYRGSDAGIFLLRLDAGLAALRYSTIVGGNANYTGASQGVAGSEDQPRIELAANGDVVLASTVSGPITIAAGTPTFNAAAQGLGDILVCRIGNDGSRLVYAGYVGGSFSERFSDLALGAADDPYVVGSTQSRDIATTTGAYRTQFPNNRLTCGIVAHIAPDGRSILYATMFEEAPITVAVTPSGEALIGGVTSYGLLDLPLTPGVFDTQYDNSREGFLAKLAPDGGSLRFCTLVGNSGEETVEGIIVQPDKIILAVRVRLGRFPEISCDGTRRLIQAQGYDFFVCCLSPDARQFRLSIPFTGESNDYVGHMKMLEGSQELVIGLTSHSRDFPTTAGSYQTAKLNGTDDQMAVIKLKPKIAPDFLVEIDSCGFTRFIDRTPADCLWGVPDWRPSSWRWEFGDGGVASGTSVSHVYRQAGQYRVKLVVGSPVDSIARTVVVPPFVPSTVVTAHIERDLFAGSGDSVLVPIILDSDPTSAAVTSIAITLHYDTLMAYPVGLDSTTFDSLRRQTLLEGWRLIGMDTLPGTLTFRFVSDTVGKVLAGPGTLLRVRFGTFISTRRYREIDSSLTSELPFDIAAPGRCAGAATSPGLLRLSVCGLQYRLIEMIEGNKYALGPAGPNPFTAFTAIPFSLGLDGPTRLEIRDVSGRLVTTLVDEILAAGSYRVVWDARGTPSGLYFFRLVSGDWSRTGTLHLVQ